MTGFRRLTRRSVLGSGGLMVGLLHHSAHARSAPVTLPQVSLATQPATNKVPVRLNVNGRSHDLDLDTRTTLLDALREHLGLTGTKKGCDHGQCGACTVLINGNRRNACLSLAVARDGEQITTIEGLAEGDKLHPVQAAFVQHDAFQCGYCTPGQICSAIGMLSEIERGVPSAASADPAGAPARDDAELRERMSGNICRCAAYPNILAAIRSVESAT